MIDAPEAYRLGLVNYVVPAGEEVNMAKSLIEKIGTKGPIAIAKVIESINAYFEEGVDGFAYEIKAFGDTTKTADFREGASAFVEKRAANFKGE
jgi:enoyl-CoA hydratase